MLIMLLGQPKNIAIANISMDSILQGDEGVSLTLVCTIENGQPPADLQWVSNGVMLSKGNGSEVTYTFDEGQKYFCYGNTSSYHLNTSVVLDIRCKLI